MPGSLVGDEVIIMSRPEPEHAGTRDGVRLPWSRSDRLLPRAVVRPLQSFLATESASGVFLLAAAAIALAWANSPWQAGYEQLWGIRLVIGVGDLAVADDLRGWVGDGLMALFFLVAGLEIKRELVTGELRHRGAAVLPVAAAVGGMVVPALVYLAFNPSGLPSRGWGMAMPTDVAVSLGIVALASRHAPTSLKAFVLGLALVDDLGSILVVGIFYPTGVEWPALAAAASVALAIVALERLHVRAFPPYLVLAVALWLAFRQAGVEPALAGAILGFLTPAVAFQRPRAVSREAHRVADETVDDPSPPDADAHNWLRLAELSREAVSPLARIESRLHPWASYLIVPVFILANAGITLSRAAIVDAAGSPVAVGLLAARVLGKPLGIVAAVLLVVRLGLARLPEGVGRSHLIAAGAAAGVPFTVSLLVAEIAFDDPALLAVAKVGMVAAAIAAGVAGYLLLRRARGPDPDRRLTPRRP